MFSGDPVVVYTDMFILDIGDISEAKMVRNKTDPLNILTKQ